VEATAGPWPQLGPQSHRGDVRRRRWGSGSVGRRRDWGHPHWGQEGERAFQAEGTAEAKAWRQGRGGVLRWGRKRTGLRVRRPGYHRPHLGLAVALGSLELSFPIWKWEDEL